MNYDEAENIIKQDLCPLCKLPLTNYYGHCYCKNHGSVYGDCYITINGKLVNSQLHYTLQKHKTYTNIKNKW